MGIRRRSRELAMQALFEMDMSHDDSMARLALFQDSFKPAKKVLPFFTLLVKGVIENKTEIDSLIDRHSSNWKLSRISCVDRNIIRVAVFEILFCQDIPAKVSINEAIDIGKKFSTEESGAFINGILDSVHVSLLEKESI